MAFFLLMNPDPKELSEGITSEQRKKKELEFFKEEKWRGLDLNFNRIGVDAHRSFLQSLLEAHIEKELPQVRSEIYQLLTKSKDQLQKLGQERSSVADQRLFLSKLSSTLSAIVQSAIDGRYQDLSSGFFKTDKETSSSNRLRARIHRLNSGFANFMRDKSQKYKASEVSDAADQGDKHVEGIAGDDVNHLCGIDSPVYMTEKEFDGWVVEVCRPDNVIMVAYGDEGIQGYQRIRTARELQQYAPDRAVP